MTLQIEATFDGEVFRPAVEVELEPNTKVKLTVESDGTEIGESYSFLRVARSLKLDGPADFSKNLDDYLYGGKSLDEE